jgi:hypothetical protein
LRLCAFAREFYLSLYPEIASRQDAKIIAPDGNLFSTALPLMHHNQKSGAWCRKSVLFILFAPLRENFIFPLS